MTFGLSNGWTGGQYSLYRVFFGAYLFVHFTALLPWGAEVFSNRGVLPDAAVSPLARLFPNLLALWDAPAVVIALLLAAAAASVLFAAGKWDRIAAVAMWYALACLFGRNPLIANPALPFVGWLLLAHAVLPRAPYGSLAARGRPDPAGDWRMPPALFAAAWAVMALAYSYSGYTKLVSSSWTDGSAFAYVLQNPLARPIFLREWLLASPEWLLVAKTWFGLGLELLFVPLALFRALRPAIWFLMLGMHLGLLLLIDFADLTLGMVALHFFTFDPAWVKPRHAGDAETLFYDGHCGLCHGFVRFVLAEDRSGARFRFAPLGGEHFASAVPQAARGALPDSLVLRTARGELLVKSRAVLHALGGLGGMWRVAAAVLGLVPAGLRDVVYDLVARIRYRIFGTTTEACPLVPPRLRARFLE